MNFIRPTDALANPLDLLLADVALRIQLSPAQHDIAVKRYQDVAEMVERPESPLTNFVTQFYPQGSMPIGATISSSLDNEDYDIDVVVELDLPADTPPQEVLDLLFEAVRGEPGSHYHHITKRRTRCITVHFNGMHLDLTPAILVPERQPLTSWIMHHKPDAPGEPTYRTLANPSGFAEWYREKTPLDHVFSEAFAHLARMAPGYEVLSKADAEPVPEHEPIVRKSMALVTLQLTKRWRNKQYEDRKGRRPPSPLIARLNADAAGQTTTLAEEFEFQARHMLGRFEQAHAAGKLIEVTNPKCHEDEFTDRWPANREDQDCFVRDLRNLVRKVTRLREADCGFDEMRTIMIELFGERPTGAAFDGFNEALGKAVRSGNAATDQSGRLDLVRSGVVAGVPTVAMSRPARTAPRNTFFGGKWPPK